MAVKGFLAGMGECNATLDHINAAPFKYPFK